MVTINFNPFLRVRKFLDEGATKIAMSEELNAFASKATTQVRRHLVNQTKLPYGHMVKAVTLKRSWAANLEARIVVKDEPTTLGRFMSWYSKRPAAGSRRAKGWVQKMRLKVWAGTQSFPVHPSARPFVIYTSRPIPLIAAHVRGSRKIKVLSGPVLAGKRQDTGEVSRLETKTYINVEMPQAMNDAIDARLDRLLSAKLWGT